MHLPSEQALRHELSLNTRPNRDLSVPTVILPHLTMHLQNDRNKLGWKSLLWVKGMSSDTALSGVCTLHFFIAAWTFFSFLAAGIGMLKDVITDIDSKLYQSVAWSLAIVCSGFSQVMILKKLLVTVTGLLQYSQSKTFIRSESARNLREE